MDIKVIVPEFIGSFETASDYVITAKNKKEPYFVSITGNNKVQFRFKVVDGKRTPIKRKDDNKKLPMSFCI